MTIETGKIVSRMNEKVQAENGISMPPEINQNQKKTIPLEICRQKNVPPKEPVLQAIREFKEYALAEISKLQVEAYEAGILTRGESIQSITNMDPESLLLTHMQSALIDTRDKLKALQDALDTIEGSEIIINSLQRNERGDAELFLHVNDGKYVFDSTQGKNGEFYAWNGINWQIDLDKQRYRDMEYVSKKYEWAAEQICNPQIVGETRAESLKKELKKRASELRTARRCSNVFVWVSAEIPFKFEWDLCPGFLPCLNGIVNLTTGELEVHKPELYIRTVCPTKYVKNAPRVLFEKFLDDIMLGNDEMKSFLKRVKGAALFGNPKEEKIIYLYGEKGRNGKGTFMQTIEKIIGKLARTFPSEMLLLQRNPPSSNSASPELANLQGVRFAIFSEINKGRKIDASKIKNLSGRDSISCRRLFSNIDLNITPTHTMFIQTNYKPEAPSDDDGLWKRNVLIPFNAEFVDDPQLAHQRKLDPGFKDKLIGEREGILAWLIEGCLEFQRDGLRIPEIVRQETENYRKENDGIAIFLEERCVLDSAFQTPADKVRRSIKTFCEENGFTVPSERDIKDCLEKTFQRTKTNRGYVWKGISIPGDQCTEVNR